MSEYEDTYFFNPDEALKAALNKNRVKLTAVCNGLQICYYDGEKIENGPENLIHVPYKDIFDYFIDTMNRPPIRIKFDDTRFNALEAQERLEEINNTFINVNKHRDQRRQRYLELIRNKEPDFSEKKKRAFLMTSRHTTVIQYSSKGIAKALEKMGYEVKILTEEDDMQALYQDLRVKEIFEFNPHVVININHMYNDIINEKTWNIVWWQDPVEELLSDKPVHVRKRDIIFSYDKTFDEFWVRKQAAPIYRQDFCIDSEIFFPQPGIHRENKIVFVGGSYYGYFKSLGLPPEIRKELTCWLEDGVYFMEEDVIQLGHQHQICFDKYPIPSLLQGVVRDTTVKWMCEESDIDVEIYGRKWEEYEFARPFFKGELPHGKVLADVYCSSKYALVCSGANIQNQRLFETAACGAIPLVYDSRPFSTDPLWEDQYLFFRTRHELKQAIGQVPKMMDGTFERINNRFSYDCFAKKIHRMTAR